MDGAQTARRLDGSVDGGGSDEPSGRRGPQDLPATVTVGREVLLAAVGISWWALTVIRATVTLLFLRAVAAGTTAPASDPPDEG